MRSVAFPAGFWNLPDRAKEQVRIGNILVEHTVAIFETCVELGIPFSLENPNTSLVWRLKRLETFATKHNLSKVAYDNCCFGETYKKRTRLMVSGDFLDPLNQVCKCGPDVVHDYLSNWYHERGKNLSNTAASAAYPLPLCIEWAACVANATGE
jgi:hypothetical protein